jgi:hypothetical protein
LLLKHADEHKGNQFTRLLVTETLIAKYFYIIFRRIVTFNQKIYILWKPLLFNQHYAKKLPPRTQMTLASGGNSIKGRPRKNRDLLIGRAGRIAIEQEDRARDSLRWQRRKQTIEKFRAI